jgi:hypothetical protein
MIGQLAAVMAAVACLLVLIAALTIGIKLWR